MNQYANPYLNPYGMQQQSYQQYPVGPVMQVTKVNGEPGARSFQMGANSSALLLDESGLMVWLVTSDGAGYRTVTAYDIIPHQEAPKPDYGKLEKRIARLEELMNGNANTADTATARKKPADKSGNSEG